MFPWDPCSAALRTEVHSGSGPSFAESFCFYVRDDVSYPLAPVDTERVCAALGNCLTDRRLDEPHSAHPVPDGGNPYQHAVYILNGIKYMWMRTRKIMK